MKKANRAAAYYAAHKDEIKAKNAAYRASHKAELAIYDAAYKAAHKVSIKARNRAYYASHRPSFAAYHANYYASHKAERSAANAIYRATHKAESAAYELARRDRVIARRAEVKLEVLNAYGGPICACCGETLFEGLTIDHINGDGAKHRRDTRHMPIYAWLKAHGFPPGFQVLCGTCNMAKGTGDHCPHQKRIPGHPRRRVREARRAEAGGSE